MDKYKKLLDSTVAEDIALGLYLSYKENSIIEGDYNSNCGYLFVVQFDEWSIWNDIHHTSRNNYRLVIRPHYCRFTGNLEFDFRTKKEE